MMRPVYDEGGVTLYHGDCALVLPTLAADSVDAVVADPPYGTTACRWDTPIPFDAMWTAIKHIAKPSAAIALCASQPFSAALVMSNPAWFRHEWIWVKSTGSNFLNVVREPMKEHESVLVFSRGGWTYHPQRQPRTGSGADRARYPSRTHLASDNYRDIGPDRRGERPALRVPSSVQAFACERGQHPTQKPVALMEYLIRTYSDEGDTVLDFTAGSGPTLEAARRLGRRAIGIELEAKYIEVAIRRLQQAAMPLEVTA